MGRLGFPIEFFDPRCVVKLKLRLCMDICSGESAPVTRALLSLHGSCLAPIAAGSAQGGTAHDILQDEIFDFIIRLAWTGAIGAGLAAPPCSKYSRLRLKPGGPPALRDDKNVDGFPGLSPTLKTQVQESQQIHLRCISILAAIWSTGRFVCYAQPPGSLAFCEPVIISFLRSMHAVIAQTPACNWQSNYENSGLLVLQTLACQASQTHANSHEVSIQAFEAANAPRDLFFQRTQQSTLQS